MGACITVCYSCLNAIGIVSDDSVSHRSKVDSLLKDRDNPYVDGRKCPSQASLDSGKSAYNGPAFDRESPKTGNPATAFSPLTNPKDKGDQSSKRNNFGSFRKSNSRND